jgi:UDP-galactopyranose mutase
MNSVFKEIDLKTNGNIDCSVCFSHLRWDFVFQRPQHIISRLSSSIPVLFWEEPIFDGEDTRIELMEISPSLTVARPHLPAGRPAAEAAQAQKRLLDIALAERGMRPSLLWY